MSNFVGRSFTVSGNFDFGNGNDELPALVSVLLLLSQDFLSEVPGQQQAVVRLVFRQPPRVVDLQVSSRRVVSLLDRAAVDDVVDLVLTDAEVIQQRAAFGRSSVDGDPFVVRFELTEQLGEFCSQMLDSLTEAGVRSSIVNPLGFFGEK